MNRHSKCLFKRIDAAENEITDKKEKVKTYKREYNLKKLGRE